MKILFYLPLLVLAWTVPATGEDDRPETSPMGIRSEIEAILAQPAIELEDLFKLAELTNPHLAVANSEVQARTGGMRQAGLFPNPEISLARREGSLDDPSFHKQVVELSQAFPIGGRRGAAVSGARAEVEQAGELALRVRRNALGRVHQLWADLLYFREIEAAFAELNVHAERTLEIARARFEAKAAPESHVTRAMLEMYHLEVAQQEIAGERVRSSAEMKMVFGGVEVPVERLSGSLPSSAVKIDLQPNSSAKSIDHPTVRAARLGVTAAEAQLVTAQKERIPDLKLFVAYGRARPDEGNFVECGVSFPLPVFNRNQGRVLEKASQVTQARHEERIAAHEFEAALSSARVTFRTTQGQMVQLTEQIAPAAERSLTQAREAYRSGRLMFMELVDAQRTFNEVLLRQLELRRDLALAEADLMSLLGAGPYADIGEK